jgi:hypothetical protein
MLFTKRARKSVREEERERRRKLKRERGQGPGGERTKRERATTIPVCGRREPKGQGYDNREDREKKGGKRKTATDSKYHW